MACLKVPSAGRLPWQRCAGQQARLSAGAYAAKHLVGSARQPCTAIMANRASSLHLFLRGRTPNWQTAEGQKQLNLITAPEHFLYFLFPFRTLYAGEGVAHKSSLFARYRTPRRRGGGGRRDASPIHGQRPNDWQFYDAWRIAAEALTPPPITRRHEQTRSPKL